MNDYPTTPKTRKRRAPRTPAQLSPPKNPAKLRSNRCRRMPESDTNRPITTSIDVALKKLDISIDSGIESEGSRSQPVSEHETVAVEVEVEQEVRPNNGEGASQRDLPQRQPCTPPRETLKRHSVVTKALKQSSVAGWDDPEDDILPKKLPLLWAPKANRRRPCLFEHDKLNFKPLAMNFDAKDVNA